MPTPEPSTTAASFAPLVSASWRPLPRSSREIAAILSACRAFSITTQISFDIYILRMQYAGTSRQEAVELGSDDCRLPTGSCILDLLILHQLIHQRADLLGRIGARNDLVFFSRIRRQPRNQA